MDAKGALSSGMLIISDDHSREETSNPNGCKATDWVGKCLNPVYLTGIIFY